MFVTGICSLCIIVASHSCAVESLLSGGFINSEIQVSAKMVSRQGATLRLGAFARKKSHTHINFLLI
jgi:hypothetical protein